MIQRVSLAIVFLAGTLMIVSFFIPRDPFPLVSQWALKWFIIISAFALLLGIDSLVLHHLRRVQGRHRDMLYSIVLVVGFFVAIGWATYEWLHMGMLNAVEFGESGFLSWLRYGSPFDTKSSYLWLYQYVFVPLDATMFSLLAFFIASAAYRAFRARTFEATLLLVAAAIVMLGRVPGGGYVAAALVSAFFFLLALRMFQRWRLSEGFSILLLSMAVLSLLLAVGALIPPVYSWVAGITDPLSGWIMKVPQTASNRGIQLGIYLGGLAFSLRVLVGIERGYLR